MRATFSAGVYDPYCRILCIRIALVIKFYGVVILVALIRKVRDYQARLRI